MLNRHLSRRREMQAGIAYERSRAEAHHRRVDRLREAPRPPKVTPKNKETR